MKEQMDTMKFKGRPYTTVNTRIIAFRQLEQFKGYGMETEWLSTGDEAMCIVKITNEKGMVIATGTAMEKRNEGYVNETSHIENCETSAVGRALGFTGIGVENSICTFDEVVQAVARQNEPKKRPAAKKGYRGN